jgi:hypothetical protein
MSVRASAHRSRARPSAPSSVPRARCRRTAPFDFVDQAVSYQEIRELFDV